MTDEREQYILEVIADLAASGTPPTNPQIYSVVGGHRGDVVQVARDWRAAQRAGGGVVAPDPEDSETPPSASEVLALDLAAHRSRYEGYHSAWEAIAALDAEGELSDAQMDQQIRLERRLASNLTRQQALEHALGVALLVEAASAGRAQHDAGCADAKRLAEEVIAADAQYAACLHRLVLHVDQQIDQLTLIRSHDGHQQFPLPTGHEEARSLLGRLRPGDFRAANMVDMFLTSPVTQGRRDEALDGFARSQPFPPRLLERYLTDMEGVSA
jgi:hypothetical protein